MYAVSLYTHNLFGENKSEQFKEYTLKKEKQKVKNVVLIMGESLTYKQMELYNSNFKNTPQLNTLLDDTNFHYTRGISAGVNTPVTIANFMSNKREATNHRLITDGTFNLLRLANENGYETYWLSKQKEGASIGSVLQFAKHKKIAMHYPENSFDDVLLNDLETIDFTKDNFIILHLRANHSPYERYTPKEFITGDYKGLEYKEYKVQTYQDSIRYIDDLLVRIFNKVKEKASQDYSIYFVSDHGEMFAMEYENGKYGHSELFFEVGKIPFLLYTDIKREKLKPYMSHHQISKMITKDLGYNLMNPNDDNNTYYINNVQSDGGAGSIEYKLSDINESGYTGKQI
jgi:glucan phosphoethanolaminetransferase (alkaline phosphatase superfamily)